MRMNRGGIYRMNQSQPNISSHIQSYHDGGIVKPAAVCVIDVNQRTKEKEKSLTALQCIVYVKIVLSSLKFSYIFQSLLNAKNYCFQLYCNVELL